MTSLLSSPVDDLMPSGGHDGADQFQCAGSLEEFMGDLDSLAHHDVDAALPDDENEARQEQEDSEDDDAGMDDEDGDLDDDCDNETASKRPGIQFALTLPVDGEVTARRGSCIMGTTSTTAKRKAAVRTTTQKKGAASKAAGKKPLVPTTNSMRLKASQSVYQSGGKALIKSVSTNNLPSNASGLLNKPFGFGAAGSASQSTFAVPLTTRAAGKAALGECQTARGSASGNKENALEAASGAQTARVKVVSTGRFMVVNNCNKTKNVTTIEKLNPLAAKQQQPAAVLRRSSMTDATTAAANQKGAGKRRSAAIEAVENPAEPTEEGEGSAHKKAKTSQAPLCSPIAESPLARELDGSFASPIEGDARRLSFADDSEMALAPMTDSPAFAKLQREAMQHKCENITLTNDILAARASLEDKDVEMAAVKAENVTLTETIASLREREETLTTDLADSREKLSSARAMLEDAIEAEQKLHPLLGKNFDLDQEVKTLKAQVLAMEASQAKQEQGSRMLATQKFQLVKEVQALKERLRAAGGSHSSSSSRDDGWTSGESMLFDSASSLMEGRRATAMPSSANRR